MKRLFLIVVLVAAAWSANAQKYMIVNSEKIFKSLDAYNSAIESLDKLAEEIFEVRPGGAVRRYSGSWSDYHAKRAAEDAAAETAAPAEKPAAAKEVPPRQQKLKFSYKEQREFETIDGEIAPPEQALEDCERAVAAAGSDYVAAQKWTEEQERLKAALEEKTERWLYLNELAEQIEAQKH